MKLTKEQVNQLQEKLAGNKNPEEIAELAKECGIDISAEDMKKVLEDANGMQALSDDETAKVSGGSDIDLPPHIYRAIKEAYEEGGPSLAVATCLFYIPSPICYNIVHTMEHEMGLYY